MALFQLVAHGPQNNDFNNKIVNQNVNLSLDRNNQGFRLVLPRNGDTFFYKYLAFEFQNNISENDFNNIIKNAYFELKIGGCTIIKNKLSFFTLVDPIKIKNNKVIITLPMDYFMNEIYLIKVQYNEITININDIENINLINNCALYGTYRFYDNPERQQIAQQEKDILIQNLQSKYIVLEDPVTEIKMRLCFNHICRGYFIEGPINNLSQIKLFVNAHERLHYDDLMVDLFCKKISDNLIYLPLDNNFNFTDFKEKSIKDAYRQGLNQSRVDNLSIKLTFIEPTNKAGVHSLTTNKLRYAAGIAGVAFADGTGFETVHENEIGNNVTPSPQIINQIIKWATENKLLNMQKNSCCPITYDDFTPGCKYCNCHQCKYNFSEEGLIECFKEMQKNCPMCKTKWENWTVYTNC
jgi:hypothetical protein